ncbi:MAG: hypothetical protein DIU80_021720 [Chloroflexota bacterium]|nr:MAG: hypothetical protein DIU80_11290 [Chloroflexota bacterium]
MGNRRVEAFLLRVVVQEGTGSADDPMRGQIRHIASGVERHFHCIHEALAFIHEKCSGDFSRLTVEVEERRTT